MKTKRPTPAEHQALSKGNNSAKPKTVSAPRPSAQSPKPRPALTHEFTFSVGDTKTNYVTTEISIWGGLPCGGS